MEREKTRDEAPEVDEARETGDDSGDSSGHREVDISDTVAPSVGPHTTFERDSPEERLARHEQSTTDAMGLDKRRSVVGGSYGPSFARQATLYGIFVVVIVALAIGFKVLADKLDEPPETIKETAPWSKTQGSQEPPNNPDIQLP